MEYVTEDKEFIIGRCERCRHEITVSKSNTIAVADGFDLRDTVKCQCGNIHNLILGNVKTRKWSKEKIKFNPNYESPDKDSDTVSCPLCHCTQLYASGKGFSFGQAVTGGFLFGPYGLLGGLVGCNRTIITCLKCGHKWEAGRR